MNDFLFSQLLPRLESLEAQNKKLEARFNSRPQLDFTIKTDDVDKLIDAITKIYKNFSAANLVIKVSLEVI